MTFTTGDDNVTLLHLDDDVDALAGDDIVDGGEGSDIIRGNDGNDVIYAGADQEHASNDDLLYGGNGDDVFYDGSSTHYGHGDDVMYGDAGNDTFYSAGSGFNTLHGGDDNDTFYLAGGETAYGDDGDDIFYTAQDYLNPTWSVISANTTLYGGSGNDIFYAASHGGNQIYDGGTGYDKLYLQQNYYTGQNMVIEASSAGAGFVGRQNTVGAYHLEYSNMEEIWGTINNDSFFASATSGNKFFGNDGNDTFYLGVGGYGGNTINGGSGDDWATYKFYVSGKASYTNSNITTNMTVDLVTGTVDYNSDGIIEDNLVSIENIKTGDGDDLITGTSGNNILDGSNGTNTVNAGDGDDVIHADTGVDIVDGGIGFDTISYENSTNNNGVIIDMGAGTTSEWWNGNVTDTFTNIERVVGTFYDDTITGSSGDDVIAPGAGDDMIDGGSGNDTIDYTGLATSFLLIDLASGEVTEDRNMDVEDTLVSIENVILDKSRKASVFGDSNDNIFTGSRADDYFDGRGGNDTIDYSYETSNLTINLGLGTMDDNGSGYGNNGTFTSIENFITGSGHDIIYGDGNDNVIESGSGNDYVVLEGGNDEAHTGSGVDTILTGNGNDTVYAGDGNDFINYNSSTSTAYTSWWGLQNLHGEGGDDLIYGGIAIDYIYGGEGADAIHALGSGDFVYGGAGDDLIYAGDAADVVYGDGGNDTIYAGDGNDSLYGGAGDDLIYGEDGADTIEGNDGDDTIYAGSGNDTVYGGEGNNTYISGDGVDVFYGGSGIDTFNDGDLSQTGDKYFYGYAGDDVIYGGTGNDSLHGGDDNDTIYGGDGGDYITGGNGDDVIYGGAGGNGIYGNAGADTFHIEQTGTGTFLGDFSVSESDKIDLSALLGNYDPLTDVITDFIQVTASGANSLVEVSINGDGVWSAAANVGGGDLASDYTADDLATINAAFIY